MPPVNQASSSLIPTMMLSAQTDMDKLASAGAQTTKLIPSPTSLEALTASRVAAPDPRRISQAKNKGLALGPTRGPLSSKYTWRKPIAKKGPVTQHFKKGKEVPRQKRKSTQPPIPAPAKRSMGRGKSPADVLLNPEGFYEVKVSYEHISKLATGCGFQTNEVQSAIDLDNAQR